MKNLFSVFDPITPWMGMSSNWISVMIVLGWIPSMFWFAKPQALFGGAQMLKLLMKEFKLNFNPVSTPGHTHWALSLFLMILLNNASGMTPYTFTASSHLSFTVSLALASWVSFMLYTVIFHSSSLLAHLVPIGTPYILMPFMVLIELISNVIRPLTLSVRLAANLVAGHLLMTLISSPISAQNFPVMSVFMSGLLLLLILESAVAFIQAYVFSMLSTLYLSEVNSMKLNYLCNFQKY